MAKAQILRWGELSDVRPFFDEKRGMKNGDGTAAPGAVFRPAPSVLLFYPRTMHFDYPHK
jgi:hypothetical protein